MPVDHDGDVQGLAEIIEDNGCRPRIGAAITAGHGTRFIQQQTDGKSWDLVWKIVRIENLSVISAQSVCIQTAPHHQTGLLPAALLVI